MKIAKANQVQKWAGVESVKSRLVTVRGQLVLLDRDVAALYGVEPREVNQAVRNNPAKFPEGYVFPLTDDEAKALRSRILILDDASSQRGRHSKHGYKVFTEKGLYMLANWRNLTNRNITMNILKGGIAMIASAMLAGSASAAEKFIVV